MNRDRMIHSSPAINDAVRKRAASAEMDLDGSRHATDVA